MVFWVNCLKKLVLEAIQVWGFVTFAGEELLVSFEDV
jgi:hypothetical protein